MSMSNDLGRLARNMLGSMVSKMCKMAGISGRTNHSLRVTGTSALYDASVPEKIIQNRTGHRSLGGLRLYERITKEQDEQVSKILSGSVKKYEGGNNDAESPDTNFSSVHSSSSASLSIASTLVQPAAKYNHCTVNMYQMPPPPPLAPCYLSWSVPCSYPQPPGIWNAPPYDFTALLYNFSPPTTTADHVVTDS